MAQKVQVLLMCDLDDDDTPAVETVTFGYDGHNYSFELCDEHLEEFHSVMQGYAASARRIDAAARRRAGSVRQPNEDVKALREWARENGYAVSDRGRISAEIRAAYEAANE